MTHTTYFTLNVPVLCDAEAPEAEEPNMTLEQWLETEPRAADLLLEWYRKQAEANRAGAAEQTLGEWLKNR